MNTHWKRLAGADGRDAERHERWPDRRGRYLPGAAVGGAVGMVGRGAATQVTQHGIRLMVNKPCAGKAQGLFVLRS